MFLYFIQLGKNRVKDMKVLLLHAPSEAEISKEDRCQVDRKGFTISIPRPPINLMYLGAISQKLGHKTTIIDAPAEGISQEECIKLLDRGFDYVVSSLSPQTMEEDVDILKYAKEKGANTIAFGYAATVRDKELMEQYAFIDIIIRGEPELPFNDILTGTPLEEINGITLNTDSEIIRNDDREFNADLDALPFPSRDLIKNGIYKDPITGRPFTTIQAGRGCKFQCTFCISRLMGGDRVRYRSVKNVVEEIKSCVTDYNISDFFFRGDTVTADKMWILDLCEEINREGLKITWYSNSRVDTIDEEMLYAMKKAGCKLITFGIESGNLEILKSVKKGITKKQAINAIKEAKEAGIITWAFYILGLPGDTEKTIDETIEFSKEVDSDLVEFHRYIPFIGADAVESERCEVSDEILTEKINRAYTDYYFRPKIILRQVKTFFLKVGSVSELVSSTRTGSVVVKRLLVRIFS